VAVYCSPFNPGLEQPGLAAQLISSTLASRSTNSTH